MAMRDMRRQLMDTCDAKFSVISEASGDWREWACRGPGFGNRVGFYFVLPCSILSTNKFLFIYFYFRKRVERVTPQDVSAAAKVTCAT